MSYSIEIKIPGLPKTTNSGGWDHWTAKVKETRHWKKEVYIAIGYKKPPKPLEKAIITLTRHSSACPDSDGLVSSFKSILDGLIDAKVIVNDKYINIGFPKYLWEPAKRGKGFITIRIEEV